MAPHNQNERSYEDLAARVVAEARIVANGIGELLQPQGHGQDLQLWKVRSYLRDGTILERWDDEALRLLGLAIQDALDAETLEVREEFVTNCWVDEEPAQEGYLQAVRIVTEKGQAVGDLQAAFKRMKVARDELVDRVAGQRAVMKLLRKA